MSSIPRGLSSTVIPCWLAPPQGLKRSCSVGRSRRDERPAAADADQRRNLEHAARADVDREFVREAVEPAWHVPQPRARDGEQGAAALDRGRIGRRGGGRAAARRSSQLRVNLVGRAAPGPTCGPRRRRDQAHHVVSIRPSGTARCPRRRPGATACGARPAGEVPDAAVVVALGVARRAGQEPPELAWKSGWPVSVRAPGESGCAVGGAGDRQHRGLARLHDD